MDREQDRQFKQALQHKEEVDSERAQQGYGDPSGKHLPHHEEQLFATDRVQDTLDPRAKNSGHKKKTADKWNQ